MKSTGKPWYKETWPWILAAGPVIVVIAGIYTYYLAVVSSDGLVTEDYYKQGLAVAETLARSDRAKALGLTANVIVRDDVLKVRLAALDPSFPPPASLKAQFSHPTRAGLDLNLDLAREGEDYVVRTRLPDSGNWLLLLEDTERSWRLLGNLRLPLSGGAVIGLPDAPRADAKTEK